MPPCIPNRKRPILNCTLAPDVDAAVRERATTTGMPVSHVTEDLLRFALGMPMPLCAPSDESCEDRSADGSADRSIRSKRRRAA